MPPIAERIRTLAMTASVTKVTLDGVPYPATGGVDAQGRPVVLARPGDPLHRVPEDAAVAVNLCAMRLLGTVEHPRGLLEAQGWLQAVPREQARDAALAVAARNADEALFEALERYGEAAAPRLLRLDVGQMVYLTGEESGVLDAEDYLDAEPDPLLETAERVLAHVNDTHRGQLAAGVSRLLGRRAGEVWLWELDRFGATVRADGSLVRVLWERPAESGLCLETALRGLLCGC
ncbi:DUF2470 domain-containing protein [Thermoactinospora rubra]|uniref:DUF2470 domain-containing protein n=1 Tax=Thermoactinospora rubra TaxID=1088767 RepID=UPI000A0F4C20|nr:DUF2470 domain-containing protein [Thermoactinospora rubra]